MMYGVGEQTTSNMAVGRTGINVCCHENGYNSEDRAWIVDDNILKKENIYSMTISSDNISTAPDNNIIQINIFLISTRKYMLWVLIRSALLRWF